MTRITTMHQKWMEEPAYGKAYQALEGEFGLAKAVIAARNHVGLTQAGLARKMGTTQPVVARLEGGRVRPSMRTLERLANATGTRLLISFEPRRVKRAADRESRAIRFPAHNGTRRLARTCSGSPRLVPMGKENPQTSTTNPHCLLPF